MIFMVLADWRFETRKRLPAGALESKSPPCRTNRDKDGAPGKIPPCRTHRDDEGATAGSGADPGLGYDGGPLNQQPYGCASYSEGLICNLGVAFMNGRIEKRIELRAPVSRVWRAVTDYGEC